LFFVQTTNSAFFLMMFRVSAFSALVLLASFFRVEGQFRLGQWSRTDVLDEFVVSNDAKSQLNRDGDDNEPVYVFLQKFPLKGTHGAIFHTEVVVCPKSGFSSQDQSMLNGKITPLTDFSELDESWWQGVTAGCVELGYGGNACTDECCSVPHSSQQTEYSLNARRSVIGNADVSQKSLFLYGESDFDGNLAYHAVCDQKCWSNWAGTDYNPLTNNCNTFTSTVLACAYGLSEKKPNLGPSDLVTVKCEKKSCKASSRQHTNKYDSS
jgi:hypothetical protein